MEEKDLTPEQKEAMETVRTIVQKIEKIVDENPDNVSSATLVSDRTGCVGFKLQGKPNHVLTAIMFDVLTSSQENGPGGVLETLMFHIFVLGGMLDISDEKLIETFKEVCKNNKDDGQQELPLDADIPFKSGGETIH